jgi:hypothetical protein
MQSFTTTSADINTATQFITEVHTTTDPHFNYRIAAFLVAKHLQHTVPAFTQIKNAKLNPDTLTVSYTLT